MTDQMLEGIEIKSHRERRREAQRSRCARQTSTERDSQRKTNAGAMRAAGNATLGPLHNTISLNLCFQFAQEKLEGLFSYI
jgi:hypothetical protein